MSKWVLFFFYGAMTLSQANAADVCGKIVKGSKHAQLIPLVGKVKTVLNDDDSVNCGASMITNMDPVWVELSDQSVLKIAPGTLFEFAGKGLKKHFLYRGNLMVSAPPSVGVYDVATPNAIVTFQGGVMVLGYEPKEKQTTVSSFNRKVEFKNKFHPEAKQVVSTGEMSRLWIGESRIHPNEPELMNPSTVKPAFAAYQLDSSESDELTAVVEKAVAERSKSFVADLESWEEITADREKKSGRSVASVSIDDREAIVGIEMLKRQLYGEETDWMVHDQSRRTPSSVVAKEVLKDTVYERRKAEVKKKVKKVLNEINAFEPDSEE